MNWSKVKGTLNYACTQSLTDKVATLLDKRYHWTSLVCLTISLFLFFYLELKYHNEQKSSPPVGWNLTLDTIIQTTDKVKRFLLKTDGHQQARACLQHRDWLTEGL